MAMWIERLSGNQRLINELFYFHNPNMHFYYYGKTGVRLLLERAGFELIGSQLLESFDWNHIYRRAGTTFTKLLFRAAGPLLAVSRFTRAENLVVIARG